MAEIHNLITSFSDQNIVIFILGCIVGALSLLLCVKIYKYVFDNNRDKLKSEILQHHELIETILESVPVTVSVKGKDFRYIYMNKYQADMLYKCSVKDALGKTASELINKQYGSYTSKKDQYVLDTGNALTNYQETITDVDGKEFEVITTKAPIFGKNKNVEGIVTIAMDISAQKLAEKKLHASLADAHKANAAKTIFIASMSHELRTPLNAIIGFSDLIINEIYGKLDNQRYLDYIKDIHFSGSHLLAMVNDVLELSKLESRQFKLTLEDYDIVEHSKEIVRNFTHDNINNNVKFTVKSSDDIPKTLTANKRMQTQIHLNLLSNAIKHLPKENGHIIINWYLKNQDELILEISDNGSGMDSETIAKIGQPFMLPNEAYHAKDAHVGNGLGLYITKKIIESRGGNFSVESEIGKGSTFRASWPLSLFTTSSNMVEK